MNEGVMVSSYENFFGGSGLPSELAVEMAAATTMHAATVADCDKDTLPTHSRRFTNPSNFNASFVSSGDCTAQNIVPGQIGFPCNTNNNVGHVGGNSISNSSFNQIPFVQIHTINVQPQSAFNSTRFRRNASSNHEEIKAEPIKSENAESTKERVNATPTPPSTSQQRSECQTTKNLVQNDTVVYSVKNGNVSIDTTQKSPNDVDAERTETCDTEATSLTYPNIYKCQHCTFICLCERDQQLHLEATHQGNFSVSRENIKRTKINCPGCENIFYAYTVVEIHLREDHLMSEHDVLELMKRIKKYNDARNEKYSDLTAATDTSTNATQRRSRIYLKNVECLREPNRDPIEQQDNLISDTLFHFDNDDCNPLENIGSISMEDQDLIGMLTSTETTFNSKLDHNLDNITNETLVSNVEANSSINRPKQKISIKSVDVLREPSLVRRDYEMQSFGDFINTCSDLSLHIANNNNNNISNISKEVNDSDKNNNGRVSDDCEQYKNYAAASDRELLVGTNSETGIVEFANDFVRPRRPKIYIKNVDILKEPMTFSDNNNATIITDSTNNNAMNFNFMPPTIPQTTNSYLDPVDALNATVPPFNGGMSQLALGTISDQYLFDGGSANFLINSVVPTNDNYTYESEENSENFLTDSDGFTDPITPIVTEPAPSSPPVATSISSTTNCMANAQIPQNTSASTNIQKQKIFIKNVDILKEPQFQEPRGLLHLRTVDELNLMNRKEVENLIAPNLEGNQTNPPEEELTDKFAHLNNTNGEPLSTIENCNDANVIEAISYDCEGFKLNEFSTQNGWHDDYDLGEDIRDIITSTMAPSVPTSQKVIHELDTPQISLISIPDMEDLNGAGVHFNAESLTDVETNLSANVDHHQVNTDFTFDCEVITTDNNIPEQVCSSDSFVNPIVACNDEPQLAAESTNVVPLESTNEVMKKEHLIQSSSAENIDNGLPQKSKAINFDDIPPLTSMSSATYTTNTTISTSATISVPSGLPVPPLVPMLPPIQFPKTVAAPTASTATNPTERGRIYVANNLMQKPNTNLQLKISSKNARDLEKQQAKTPIAVSVMGGTSVRGRPFGSNRTGITKLRKHPPIENGAGIYLKCTVAGCAFRFKKSTTLDYHIKCHTSDPNPPSMVCPECKASFTNWNSLHTHLWRGHKIDMELYSCELCSFKTPIYSRLLNTHSKIHYEERNYKCEQCEKAFKNTKQLKNHRRWHRNHNKSIITTISPSSSAKKCETSKKANATVSQNDQKDTESQLPSASNTCTANTTTVPVTVSRDFHRCKDCDAVFSHQKTLREHLCKNASAAVQCTICERVLTSRSSIKLHMQSHEPSHRFKCNACEYSTSDHNAFRRHKMTHDNNAKMYACAHCNYKSIQSVSYQKHVRQKHPQVADSIVYKCKTCSYSTINKALIDIHQIKHENRSGPKEGTTAAAVTMEIDLGGVEKSKQISHNTVNNPAAQKTKIKVKSHLVLTTASDSATEYNDLCLDAVTMPA
ncbi:uncharacterized protein LOC101449340 [Ceratitis capitata]|uniref:uncharacterized protein LOC101449340 n=1 Tax=Ceratitis capitata TaxID=7213 RepID=UPI00032A3F9D|nr:uncharacterized protein LOC101449340 [Ceratitis capitata]